LFIKELNLARGNHGQQNQRNPQEDQVLKV
jgi:hypothetical protein